MCTLGTEARPRQIRHNRNCQCKSATQPTTRVTRYHFWHQAQHDADAPHTHPFYPILSSAIHYVIVRVEQARRR